MPFVSSVSEVALESVGLFEFASSSFLSSAGESVVPIVAVVESVESSVVDYESASSVTVYSASLPSSSWTGSLT